MVGSRLYDLQPKLDNSDSLLYWYAGHDIIPQILV